MNSIVLDASVAFKWYLKDEEHGNKALSLLEQYVSNRIEIVVPTLFEYEVINGLIIAQKRGRLKNEDTLLAIEGVVNLGIELIDPKEFYPQVIDYCRKYNISAYDASYLAIAGKERPLITADERLYNTVKSDLLWVKWIGEL